MNISSFLSCQFQGNSRANDRALAYTATESFAPQGIKYLLEVPEVTLNFVAVLEVT